MWFKRALSDRARNIRNIKRLEQLHKALSELKGIGVACQSCAFQGLSAIIDNPLIRGRKDIYAKLKDAFIGPMNQKVVLDSPVRFAELIQQAIDLVGFEMNSEKDSLDKIRNNKEDTVEK